MFPYPNSASAVMPGAATLSDYRGHGIDTALMAKRLADARDMGMEAAILQADRRTSAPICARLGFVLNLRVDDLHGLLAQLRAGGVTVEDNILEWERGKHGWIRDLDGNKVELYEEIMPDEAG